MVGAGIAGAAAAFHLAGRGHTVTLYEQFESGHDRGSSHGNSRIVRKAYPDAFYTEIMLEGYPMWHALQRECPEPLLHEVGLVVFGSEQSAEMQGMLRGLEALGVPHDLEGARRMPTLRIGEHEIAVWTPEAGWVHAARAVRHLVSRAEAMGAECRRERVASLERLEADYDAVVLCAGAWNAKFLELPVEVSLQTFAYLDAPQGGPVWIEDSARFPYGFPSEPGASTFKVGIHQRGAAIDPDDPHREPSTEALDAIRDVAARRFGVAEPRLDGAKGCLYTSTANEDFLLGRVGEKIVFASACSGHGFKFGPWVGKTLADFVEGKSDPSNYPRLAFTPKRLA